MNRTQLPLSLWHLADPRRVGAVFTGIGWGIVVASLGIVIMGGCQGCSAAQSLPTTPREQARAAVLVLAEGVKLGDEACAKEALTQSSQPLALRCKVAYETARSALIVAGDGVDAWDSARRGEVACATVRGASAAEELAIAIRAYGGDVPPALTDGLALYQALVGVTCSSADGGAS